MLIVFSLNLYERCVELRNDLFREQPLAKVHYHPSPVLCLSDSVKQVFKYSIHNQVDLGSMLFNAGWCTKNGTVYFM